MLSTTTVAWRLPTASNLHRALACPPSAVLPGIDSVSSASRTGTAVHAFLQAALLHGREAALAGVPDEARALCEALDLAALPAGRPDQFAAELVLAWDPDSDRAETCDRDVAAIREREGWFTGRADVVGINLEQARGYVGDYKTGQVGLRADQDPQLRALALYLARCYGLTSVRVEKLYLREGEVYRSWGDLDALELDAVAEELRRLVDRITAAGEIRGRGRALPVVLGDHCRYCPAYRSCPGTTALVRQAAAAPAELELEVRALLPAEVGVAHGRLKVLEALVERLRKDVDGAARELGGVPLPDGRVYGPVEARRETLRAPETAAVLERLYGPAVAAVAVEQKASKTALKEALRLVKDGRSLKALEAEALEALRAGGAVEETTRIELRESRG